VEASSPGADDEHAVKEREGIWAHAGSEKEYLGFPRDLREKTTGQAAWTTKSRSMILEAPDHGGHDLFSTFF
jgi:hypothetical protein